MTTEAWASAMNPKKEEKWLAWIRNIRTQVVHLMDSRRWNAVYEDVVNKNPALNPNNQILYYFRYIYKDYAVLAVRRLVKKDKDSITLTGLIEDIIANHTMVTRQWTFEMFRQPLPDGFTYDVSISDHLARLHWAKYCDASGEFLEKAPLEADLAGLLDATKLLVHISDREIAHNDIRKADPQFTRPTYDSLDNAITLIERLTTKCNLILTGESMASMTPFDTTNATSVFRIPWIPSER
jgi:hypothetical protein